MIGSLGVVALLLGVGPGVASGAIRVVDDDNVQCPKAIYHSVNEALTAAEPGDEIMVCAGTYNEQIILRENHPIRGIPDGFDLPVIAPTVLPTAVPAIVSGNPIVAAVTVLGSAVRLENLVIDLTGYHAPGCSPIVAGMFLQNASGTVVNTTIRGAAGARAECDSGVGMLVLSGTLEPMVLGHVIPGRSMISAHTMTFQGNQRAAVAAIGDRTVVRIVDALVEGDGSGMPFVQHGIQYSEGGRGKLQDIRIRELGTSLTGKMAVGLLAFNTDRVRARRATMENVQTGAFLFGNRHRLAAGRFSDIHSDGVVVFGDKNRVLKTEMTVSSIDGVFLDGDSNLIRGGGYADIPIGIWDYLGDGNQAAQIQFLRVQERVRIGGVRDLTPDAAMPFTLTCASAVECDDGNPCTTDACDAGGTCSNTILADGTSCADATVCNGVEVCGSGVCQPGTPLVCDDGDPCTADTCDPVLGCENTVVPDGTPCPDTNLCNGTETCVGGACVAGVPLACDDGNVCTFDTCDSAMGCQVTAVADGTSCADGDACNGAETCMGGACTPGTPLVCDDGNPCTTDSCDALLGCQHANVADGTSCDDGDVCNGAETCTGGVCTPGVPLACGDGDPCTADGCDPVLGCQNTVVPDGTPCPDADACNGTETCVGGACTPGNPLVCDDGNPCTTDGCDPVLGCQSMPVADGTSCADADVCNGTETCMGGACVAGTPLVCDDGNPCTTDGCDPVLGCQFVDVPDGTSCADANLCNGTETCTGGTCMPGVPLACDDGNPCTDDGCDSATGCFFTNDDANPCDDLNACTGPDSCSAGVCSGPLTPAALACSNNDVCDGLETCNPATGTCDPGTPLVCDDANECTTDGCDPTFGCQFVAVLDGTPCTGGTCLGGFCL